MIAKQFFNLNGDPSDAKNLPPLPSSWCWASLDDLIENFDGCRIPVKSDDRDKRPGPYPYYSASGVIDDIDDFIFDGDYLLIAEDGANLLSRSTPIAFRASGKFWVNNHAHIVQMRGDIALGYLQWYLNGTNLQFFITGTAQPKLNQVNLNRIPVPVAPLAEQSKIVAKIEELFSDLDAGVAALKRAKANLKRYRASVLKAAVEGKLTEEWRAKHPAKEPASDLLARILEERRQKWEADQHAKFASAKKEPPKNWREKYVEPTPPDTSGLPELPADWTWASVQQVGSVQLGRQRAPQHHSGDHMRPYLRVANVFEDRIDTSDVMEMNFTPNEFETYRLGSGDILLNEGQSMELVGRPAIYRDEVPGACFTNTLVRFRVYDNVDTDYALRVFLAYLKNGRFQKIATITVNIAHLGAGRFAEIEFPLPPIEEQAAIIEEVDRHFSLIDAAEKAINLSMARASRLRQSILKQAFEGKLVPQDPKDEPASVLLARMRASRTHDEANGKAATPTRTRKPSAKSKQLQGGPTNG